MQLKNKVQKVVFTGVMAAVVAVLSLISIPLPSGVPVTLQTFAVALCGYVLGPWLGTAAVGVYLAVGAVGLPVFAGMTGGVGVLAGVTGGYLWGFLFLALLCGLGQRTGRHWGAIALGLGGLAVCHLLGCVWFSMVSHTGLVETFLLASAPYLLKDVLSVAGAYAAALGVQVSLRKVRAA